MARSKQTTSPPIGSPEIPPSKGIELLRTQITKADLLLANRPLTNDAHSSWELTTRNFLEKAFGRNSPNVTSVLSAGRAAFYSLSSSEAWFEEQRAKQLNAQKARLESLIEVLETQCSFEPPQADSSHITNHSQKVFLVHGHDETILHQSARLLERLGLEVIVLREQPNQGKTIIEKFESYSDVGFALVLLTGDDQGSAKGMVPEQLKPRARQNVVFELGYFIGKLGRNRVCALYSDGVEVPSDYSGVVYTKIDSGSGWRFEVAKELRAAGYPVDLNQVL